MSKTIQYRFEVSHKDYGVLSHERTLKDAVDCAQNWIESTKNDYTDKTCTIFDRMRPNAPVRTVSVCTGEAHGNPYIDNCWSCAPRWGVVVSGNTEALVAHLR